MKYFNEANEGKVFKNIILHFKAPLPTITFNKLFNKYIFFFFLIKPLNQELCNQTLCLKNIFDNVQMLTSSLG